MKFLKSVIICLIMALSLNIVACTYTANGSVIQDVTFSVSYTNTDGEDVNVDATLSLYKTFAPKTCDHLLQYMKDGFYNDTQVVFDEMGKYLILGAYDLNGKDIITEKTVKGEFEQNGFQSRLKAEKGTLVLLREPDSGKGDKKYNTGKAVFAILLEDDIQGISNKFYTVFGKIDEESLEEFIDMRDDLYKDDDGFVKIKYVADRYDDEESDNYDDRKIENGAYVGGFEYYVNANDSTYFNLDKELLDYSTDVNEDKDGYADQALYEKLSGAYSYDLNAMPINKITAKNFKLK